MYPEQRSYPVVTEELATYVTAPTCSTR